MNIVIYGAGKYGQSMLEILEKLKVVLNNNIYFCQSKRETEYINGHKVLEPNDLIELEDAIVLLAIKNKNIQVSIREMLLELKVTNVYSVSEFVAAWNENNSKSQGCFNCNICGHANVDMIGAGISAEIFQKHHIIGGGYRVNNVCAICGGSDRERWQKWVLENKTDIFTKPTKVLHFAPEIRISKLIKKTNLCDYYTGDICWGKAEHIIDITDIPFKNNFFDYVIANHIMEHILDEKTAIAELLRVIKSDGKIILSFPICMDMETFENDAINTEEQRLKYYGQEDHVRLYGTDFKERLEAYGMDIQVLNPKNFLSEKEIEKMAVDKDDAILLCSKKRN